MARYRIVEKKKGSKVWYMVEERRWFWWSWVCGHACLKFAEESLNRLVEQDNSEEISRVVKEVDTRADKGGAECRCGYELVECSTNAATAASAPDLYAENQRLRAVNGKLREVVERHVDYLKSELFHLGPPPKGHTCGPEGNCDSSCEARYHLASDLESARAVLGEVAIEG